MRGAFHFSGSAAIGEPDEHGRVLWRATIAKPLDFLLEALF
jgi:hypothetical protein